MIVSESMLRDMMRLLIWYPIRWLLYALPLRSGINLINFLGTIDTCTFSGKKKMIMRKVTEVFPEKDETWTSEVVKTYIRNHYMNQLQIMLFPKMRLSNIDKIHFFEGLDRLDNALKKGKGCILIHPHFGPTQLPLHILGIKGYNMMQLGYLTDDGLSYIGKNVAFKLRTKLESKIKARIVQADSFLRPLFQCLKSNGVLMMTGDGAGGKKFIGRYKPFPFCNGTYLFSMGAATLAAKTGAPMMPVFITMEGNRYKTNIEPPIYVKNDDEDIYKATFHFVKTFESYLKKNPGFWHFWDELEHRRVNEQ
jgi:lauroyl/myristoyl acyltransferase